MDISSIIEFSIRNIKKIIIIVLLILVLVWLIVFFSVNSIVLLTAKTSYTATESNAALILNSLATRDITLNTKNILVIPKNTITLTVKTSQSATIVPVNIPFVFGSIDINLKPLKSTSYIATTNRNCYLKKPQKTYLWNCNKQSIDIQTVHYETTRYPYYTLSNVDLSDYQYATNYNEGFIALHLSNNFDVEYYNVFDQSISKLNIGDKFTYTYTQVVVDTEKPKDFVVFDINSLQYKYYTDGNLATNGTLPETFKTIDNDSMSFSLNNGDLTVYRGVSSDDLDNHSGDKVKSDGRIEVFSLRTAKSISADDISNLTCSQAYRIRNYIACLDRDVTQIYKRSEYTTPILSLKNTSSLHLHRSLIYITQGDSLYEFNPESMPTSLNAVYRLHDRSIANVMLRDNEAIITSWTTYKDSSQLQSIYLTSLDTAQQAVKPELDNLPLNLPDTLVYGSEVTESTIYIMLIENNQQNRDKVMKILQNAHVTNRRKILFF